MQCCGWGKNVEGLKFKVGLNELGSIGSRSSRGSRGGEASSILPSLLPSLLPSFLTSFLPYFPTSLLPFIIPLVSNYFFNTIIVRSDLEFGKSLFEFITAEEVIVFILVKHLF